MPTEFSWIGAGITAGITATLVLQWWLRRIPVAFALDPEVPESSALDTGELLDARLPRAVILALIATTAILGMLRQDYGRLLSDSLLLAALTGIAWWDWRHLTIDIRLIALTALLQSGWSVLFVPASTIELLLGGVFGAGGLYWLGMLYAAVRGIEGLGEGDPAVLGLIGLWVGWQGLLTTVLIAALSGLLIGGFVLLRTRQPLLQTRIPFAPFLCLGGVSTILLQQACLCKSPWLAFLHSF
jgi:prepilin signal peptidase PulO-like enzyme (type II secretory pathway)